MKKKCLTTLFLLMICSAHLKSQTVDFAENWKKSIEGSFKNNEVSLEKAEGWDLSKLITNTNEGCFSSYLGVFGPQHRRIDFRLEAEKKEANSNKYLLSGKCKLGQNVRLLNGELAMTNLYYVPYENKETYLALFKCQFSEPGSRNGDGAYAGMFSLVFVVTADQHVELLWSENGDFRAYNNMFVGKWKKFNDKTERKCIFSFEVDGLYTKLPFCSKFYLEQNSDVSTIKPQYMRLGWGDSDSNLAYRYKSMWWK